MFRIGKITVGLALAGILAGCGDRAIAAGQEEKLANVRDFFYHNEQSYTAVVVENGVGSPRRFYCSNGDHQIKCEPHFFYDVPTGQPMWLVLKKNAGGDIVTFDFHQRTDYGMNGAESQEGKNNYIQTQRIAP